MKILEIIPTLDSGGAERFVLDLSNSLYDNNIDVTILSLYKIDVEDNNLLRSISNKVRIISLNKKKGLDIRLFFTLLKLINRERPDVVHSHIDAVLYLILPMLFLRQCRYFHTIHNEAHREAYGLARLYRKFIFCFGLCVPVIISKNSLQTFKDLYNRDALLIYNGCTEFEYSTENMVEQYKINAATKVLVNVARISSQKNQLMLVEGCMGLIEMGYDIVLLIIGKKQDEILASQIEKYTGNRIKLLGECQSPRTFLQFADFFCLSSVYEGLPISLLEAFSVGCVPICTPVGGCVDVIDNGINGFLSDGISKEKYSAKLKMALDMSKEESLLMRQNTIASYKKYSMVNCAREYLQLFLNK